MSELTKIMVPRGHSVTTAKLIEALEKGKVGDVKTDEELSAACGKACACDGDGYPSLMTAIRWCISHHQIHWQRVHGAHAIKCVTSSESSLAVESNIRQVKKRMGRTLKIAQCVKVHELKEEERPTFLAMVAQVGTIAQFSSGSATKALAARSVHKPIDFAKTLQLMAGT